MTTPKNVLLTSLTILAASILAACGGGSDDGAAPSASSVTLNGVVTSAKLNPGSKTDPNFTPAYFVGAKVCVDANNNGVCESSENPVVTDAKGHFTLKTAANAALIADIGTDAKYSADGKNVPSRDVLRVALEQVNEQAAGTIVISPLSAEIIRAVEGNKTDYATEKQVLAGRIGVTPANVIADVNTLSGADQTVMMAEAKVLDNRFTYAITKLDRKDMYPDALAVSGGDPRLLKTVGVTPNSALAEDPRKPITFVDSQQAAFNVEGIPRYDNVFVVMLENKATLSIKGSPFAPKINALLQSGNQLTSYYATGIPSEPNYTALGGGDDFGITDDSQWNCDATGDNAPKDLPLPDNTQSGLASSPFAATCTGTGVNHNIVGKPNLFNALTTAGLTWRTYNESLNPGQDFRTDSVADPAVVTKDHVYAAGSLNSNAAPVGSATLNLPLPAGLYKTKHHPGMAYQNVRSAPEWAYSNRTMGGGQWDDVLKTSGSKYLKPANWDMDQLGTDLAAGNVGTLNFLVPDQCDDMHGIGVTGTDTASGLPGTASDCGSVSNNVPTNTGGAIITRGDNYVDKLVAKIQASPLWTNKNKRVAIVLMFDEGNATGGFNSCCGWNTANGTATSAPLVLGTDGKFAPDSTVVNYDKGNTGHGQSIFGILSNQPSAPKGVSDSDAYSHFSLVRTFQDMFQLADPAVDASYMNRSKYTESFIAQNIMNLPEFAGSADTHFDAVRPINHAWVATSSYTQKQSPDVSTPVKTGPDEVRTNVWAMR
jgi:hypothetical protein